MWESNYGISGGKLLEDKVILVGFYSWSISVAGDKRVFFLTQGSLTGKVYNMLLDIVGEVREPFPHLLFLKCVQLKIVNIPK